MLKTVFVASMGILTSFLAAASVGCLIFGTDHPIDVALTGALCAYSAWLSCKYIEAQDELDTVRPE